MGDGGNDLPEFLRSNHRRGGSRSCGTSGWPLAISAVLLSILFANSGVGPEEATSRALHMASGRSVDIVAGEGEGTINVPVTAPSRAAQ
jgi:hypothetical protein